MIFVTLCDPFCFALEEPPSRERYTIELKIERGHHKDESGSAVMERSGDHKTAICLTESEIVNGEWKEIEPIHNSVY